MELLEFLIQMQSEVRSEIGERLATYKDSYPYEESVFAEVVTEHMSQVGMTFDPIMCHYSKKVGNAILRLSGWSMSEDSEQLDLFVSLYGNVNEVTPVSDSDTKAAADQCIRFLTKCAEGRLAKTMDESDEAYQFAFTIQECYASLEQIRVYVLTDRVAKAKSFRPREVNGKTVKLEVMDIERLHRHLSEGKPRDELVVNFEEVAGGPLPCVFVPGDTKDYDYALTVIPGEALRFIYEKFGARLLEANVRSFLSTTVKVNKGIRDTLRDAPERFLAYNNGIVIVTDEVISAQTADGGPGILWLKGMQIVNGGQTTASIYFAKKKEPAVNLSRVRVPAKIIIMHSEDPAAEELLISDISRFANSQNSVKLSDLSANKPFHVGIEKLALSTYCPDGTSRWFYERAAGSYKTLLLREGTTPAKLKAIKDSIPTSRRITKTDLAKYLNAWGMKPDCVSFGEQKNFERFTAQTAEGQNDAFLSIPDVTTYKRLIAKAVLFRCVQSLIRPMFRAFHANIVAYLVALISDRHRDEFDLDQVWLRQDLSPELRRQIQVWAPEVHKVLHESAEGRMISEWAKKPECWSAVRRASFSKPMPGIPELR